MKTTDRKTAKAKKQDMRRDVKLDECISRVIVTPRCPAWVMQAMLRSGEWVAAAVTAK